MHIVFTDGSSSLETKVTDIEISYNCIAYKVCTGGIIRSYNKNDELIEEVEPLVEDQHCIVSMSVINQIHYFEETEETKS